MTESKRNVLAAALLIVLILFAFADVVFLGRAFYFRDVTRFYYPSARVVRQIVLSGETPQWNPYWGAGQPLAANPDYAVFYPARWLTFLPGFDFWFRLDIVLHFCLAAAGAFVLLRRWTRRVESAVFGAIVFSLGGLTVGLTCLLPFLYCIAWLPWILWAVWTRRYAIAAMALAMTMLGGEPVTIAQVCVFVVVVAFLRRRIAAAIGVVVAAAIAAAAQLVPAFDLLRDSVRVEAFPFETVARWSTPPLRLLELFVPQFTGPGVQHFRFYWATAQYGWLDPFYLGIYFGLIPVAIAIAGLTVRVRGTFVVIGMFVASALLAIGAHTPLLRLLYDAHLFRSFRYPEKFLILGLVPLMLFSAVAFDRAFVDRRIVVRAAAIAGGVALVCIALAAISFQPSYARAFIDFWGIAIHPFAMRMAELSRGVWLRAAIVSILSAAVLLIRDKRWAWIAIAVTLVDLTIQRASVAETIDGDFFRTPPAAVRSLDRSVRLFHQAEWYAGTVVARQYLDLPQMYWCIRNGLFPMFGAAWGIGSAMNADIDRTFLRPAAEFTQSMLDLRARRVPRWFEPMMVMSAAGYRALYLPFAQQVVRAANDPESIQPIIFLPVKTNGIFYFADPIVRCRSREEFVNAVAANRLAMTAAYADIQPFTPSPARIVGSNIRFNSAELDVEAAGSALLVCSITRHKYWSATIDDRPATLLPANIQFQALMIPPGRHVVRMRYRNPLLLVCAMISLISFAVLSAAAAFPLRRK